MTDIYSNKSALYYADSPRGMVLIGVVSNPGAGNIVSMLKPPPLFALDPTLSLAKIPHAVCQHLTNIHA